MGTAVCSATYVTPRTHHAHTRLPQQSATKGLVHLEDIQLETFDFGESPLRVAGLKRYSTSQDEVIVDMPVQWGSQVDIR